MFILCLNKFVDYLQQFKLLQSEFFDLRLVSY